MTAAIFASLDFKRFRGRAIIGKMILFYMIGLFFNQLSGKFVHIPPFSVNLSLAAMIPLAVSFMFSKFRKSNRPAIGASDMLKSFGIVFAILIVHAMFLFVLLKKTYGYGYERGFAVLANMCMYIIVFVLSWEQLEEIRFRRFAAISFAAFFIFMMVRGF